MSVLSAVATSFLLIFFGESIGCAEGKAVSRHEAEIQSVKVILQRVYLDGDLSEEVVLETILTRQEIQEKYEQWQLIEQQGNILIYRNQVDDISPLLKANGYFGITKEGTLTIFNGRPKHSKIIHSFFQIDVGKLESRKKQQLKRGIPVKSKDRYQQVLETFKPYSKFE